MIQSSFSRKSTLCDLPLPTQVLSRGSIIYTSVKIFQNECRQTVHWKCKSMCMGNFEQCAYLIVNTALLQGASFQIWVMWVSLHIQVFTITLLAFPVLGLGFKGYPVMSFMSLLKCIVGVLQALLCFFFAVTWFLDFLDCFSSRSPCTVHTEEISSQLSVFRWISLKFRVFQVLEGYNLSQMIQGVGSCMGTDTKRFRAVRDIVWYQSCGGRLCVPWRWCSPLHGQTSSSPIFSPSSIPVQIETQDVPALKKRSCNREFSPRLILFSINFSSLFYVYVMWKPRPLQQVRVLWWP